MSGTSIYSFIPADVDPIEQRRAALTLARVAGDDRDGLRNALAALGIHGDLPPRPPRKRVLTAAQRARKAAWQRADRAKKKLAEKQAGRYGAVYAERFNLARIERDAA